ncbi:MAG: DMT family transporter [Rhizobiaceae bacterium]|nr:DMT family transporter [Rhizobiaceae bacterium]
MAIMVAAMIFAPVMDAIAKMLATQFDVSPATVTFGRFFVQTLFLFVFLVFAWSTRALPLYISKLNILRGMIMGLAAMLFFTALKYMPLADAISVFFVEPLIVMLMSAAFLGEKVGWRRILAALIGFGGAIIVIRPSYELFGVVSLLPLCTAFLFSIYLILTRVSGGNDDPLIMQFFAGIGGVVICGAILAVATPLGLEDFSLSLPTENRAWALLLGIGLFAVASHMLIVIAFSMAPASILAPFQYIEIVSATIFGLVLFGEFPDLTKWIGILIIISSGVYIFLREKQLEKREASAG